MPPRYSPSPRVTGEAAEPPRRIAPGAYPSSPLDSIRPGAKVLWVTSTGGHLAELDAISQRLQASPDSLWVTSENEQSRAVLDGRRHLFVDYVAPRNVRAAARAAARVAPLLRREKFDVCISTGAAVAALILPLAALSGVRTYYVESLARPSSPSVTGRVMGWAPAVRTLTQYQSWASPSWAYAGCPLDDLEARGEPVPDAPLKILVTLGTIAPYRFDRVVDAVLALLREGDEVTWQLGATTRRGLPGRTVAQVPPAELEAMSVASDVVVAHGGVGSILQQLGVRKSPVVAVRSSSHAEHVDDHQQGFAETVAARGLASVLDLERPSRVILREAAGRVVTRRRPGPPSLAALPGPAA